MYRFRTALLRYAIEKGLIDASEVEPACLVDTSAAPVEPVPPPSINDQLVIMLEGPCPCDDCAHRPRCARTAEACEQFNLYVANASESRWRGAPKQPKVEIGSRLFKKAA